MPEVINLLTSTPPPPANVREPSSLARFHSSPPAPAPADLRILSDDVGLPEFTNDDEDGFKHPPKRRRLSPEPDRIADSPSDHHNALPSRSQKNLFVFSDEIAPSSDGPKAVSKASAFTLDSDPIVFTSSAPEPTRKSPSPKKDRNNRLATRDAEDILSDYRTTGTNVPRGTLGAPRGIGRRAHSWKESIEEFSDPIRVPDPSELFDFQDESDFVDSGIGSGLSSRTASLLANLGGRSDNTARANSKQPRANTIDLDEDDSDSLPEPRGRKPKKTATTTKRTMVDKEAKAKDREAAKAQRDREKQLEKQLEKERKQKLKEDKAKEKQLASDIAHANKLKVDKKDSTPEMIIDLASSFQETSIGNQTLEYMRRLGVEHTFFDSPIANVVKWRRKMKARFNDTLRHWEPCELHIRDEEHVLCLVTAQEFVDMVSSGLDSDAPDATSELEIHVLRMKSAHPDCTIIYLIEGLSAWMRKTANARNRAYQAEFRRHLDEVQGASSTAPSSTASRRKKTNKPDSPPPVDDDTIEDALLSLQVTHRCLIHQTAAAPESAEWIKNFTEHVSTVPYRRQKLEGNDSAFCMDTGQVKPGENKSDTFVRMLQEVNRVTASMAYGVINEYPSVLELVQGMRASGPTMLEDVRKSANKNGAITDSRIGPAVSRRLYKVFMGLDPNSTDV
ncbi:ERCC4 domain-containing protein [Aspergillus pseudodeflectus]|uniref:ERCC4 domain-containing protein n=1 Tax=Aspergillus pseudodeflectus TaxID=176178 RepID=A0ABR4K9P9_9EURO